MKKFLIFSFLVIIVCVIGTPFQNRKSIRAKKSKKITAQTNISNFDATKKLTSNASSNIKELFEQEKKNKTEASIESKNLKIVSLGGNLNNYV